MSANSSVFFLLADYLPTWYDQRSNGAEGADEKAAADKAATHADNAHRGPFRYSGPLDADGRR